MLRIAGAGLVALGLHAGIGYGAYRLAEIVHREHPVRLKRFLLQKQTMEEILERIQQMREDQEDDLIEVAIEEIEEIEELIEELPEPDDVGDGTELDTAYEDVAYREAGTKGDEGAMGNPDPHIARQAALRDAAEFGMIGLLNAGAGGDPDAPTAPWGRDDSLGTDPLSARGNMWGDSIGESFGKGGLGLAGIGEGGGGTGEGIGLGSIGTIGHGAGTGTGQGFGSGHGRLGRSHRARPPRVRMGSTKVSGSLPPEVVQRVVRQSFGRFRLCYEKGLSKDPNLEGRVSVRFTIGEDGSVSKVSGSGTISDKSVVSCVTRAFHSLTFPKPAGGTVSVTYPIVFAPSGSSSPAPPTGAKAGEKRAKPASKKKPRARIRSVSAGGGLDDGEVKRALEKKRSAFRSCYQSALAADPGLRGDVQLRFRVNASGSAVIGKRSEAVLSTVSASVADCALDVLSGMTFPKPKGDSGTVTFRLALSAK